MATTNYDINYNDKRFREVEADKKAALNEVDVTYGNMISQSDTYYQKQIDAAQDYADKQTQLQNEQTNFAIKEIEQNKAQAKKDYLKEQSGAYVDWQKQSNEYGVNAEQAAANGMSNSGFTANLENSLYNTYQNRVATARASYELAVQDYNNAITEARLQNNSILAEIAYEALQKRLELSLQGFQYKNNLILEKAKQKIELDNTYYGRYQDVLKQINTENALAEEVRQYDKKQEIQDKFAFTQSQATINKGDTGGSGGGSGSGKKTTTKTTTKSKGTIKSSTPSSTTKKAVDNTTPGVSTKGDVPLDTKSLIECGLAGASAKTITMLEKTGQLESYVKNGKRYFRRVVKLGFR